MELIKRYIQKNKNQYVLAVLLAILGVTAGLFAYLLLADIIVALIGNERKSSFYLYRCITILVSLSLKEVFAALSTSVSHKATFQSLKEMGRAFR
jgi:ATP-binding cassette subfamily B protein